MHGGGGSSPGGVKRARIEIIPLIDVIFFLLATFVLFTLSLTKGNGVSVRLPEVVKGDPRDPNDTVTVSILSDGTLAWNMDPVTVDEFETRLVQQKQQFPDSRILINGDERAFFAQAVFVFDQARRAQFSKVFIETHAKAKP
jgi:biopolymer transport protein ExbD